MRKIVAVPKTTSARTQFYDIAEEDMIWMAKWILEWVCEMQEVATHDIDLKTELFKKDTELPRGRQGHNSIMGMAGGVARKILSGGDLSDPQLDAIPMIFETINAVYGPQGCRPRPGFEKVEISRSLFAEV